MRLALLVACLLVLAVASSVPASADHGVKNPACKYTHDSTLGCLLESRLAGECLQPEAGVICVQVVEGVGECVHWH